MPFSLLLTALAEICDPRRPQGRRYALAPLLLFSALAVLAGATSYQDIITFIDVHRERLNAVFGARFRRAPAVNTVRNLILALDPADLEAAFRRHAQRLNERIGGEGWRTVALDGKTLRGSFDHLHDQPAAHVLSAFASDAALILAHQEVAAAPDEVPAVPALIAELGLTGVLFTADALHCQKGALNKPPRPVTPCWYESNATSPTFMTRWPPCATSNAPLTIMRAWTGTAMVARSTA
jgi:DDE_Tnp_1-associated